MSNIALTRPILNALGSAVEAVSGVWPNRREIKIVYNITKAAIDAAEIAEHAWKIGNLPQEDRNPFAKALVKETLGKAGIEITPQIAMIIDGAIEATCMLLPHAKKPAPELVGEIGE